MPAKSVAQREMMAIAEHSPSKLYARNKGVLRMSHSQLHDFAASHPTIKRAQQVGVRHNHRDLKGNPVVHGCPACEYGLKDHNAHLGAVGE